MKRTPVRSLVMLACSAAFTSPLWAGDHFRPARSIQAPYTVCPPAACPPAPCPPISGSTTPDGKGDSTSTDGSTSELPKPLDAFNNMDEPNTTNNSRPQSGGGSSRVAPFQGGTSRAGGTGPGVIAPNMIGDFFGVGGTGGAISTGDFFGRAIHLPTGSAPLIGIQASGYFTSASNALLSDRLIGLEGTPSFGTSVEFQTLMLTNPNSVFLLDPAVLANAITQNGNFTRPFNVVPEVSGGVPTGEYEIINAPASGTYAALSTGETFEVFYDNGTPLDLTDDYVIYTASIYDVYSNSAGGAPVATVPTGLTQPGAQIGRQLITENTSPVPRTRAFINYSYFDNVPLVDGGIGVHRYTPGFEYAFFNNNLSIELRAPIAVTSNSALTANNMDDTSSEFGNLTVYMKALLYNTSSFFLSTGLGIVTPTANDTSISNSYTTLIEVENQSVHLLPFIGALWMPNDRLFLQTFMQFDFDANGNTVRGLSTNGNVTDIGRINDQSFIYLDYSAGYWVHKGDAGSFINGIAPMAELHIRQSLQSSDVVTNGLVQAGGTADNITNINAVLGLTSTFNQNMSATIAYGTPIGGDDNFDGELRLIYNWYFGNGGLRNLPPNF